jgi:hypothetical protein
MDQLVFLGGVILFLFLCWEFLQCQQQSFWAFQKVGYLLWIGCSQISQYLEFVGHLHNYYCWHHKLFYQKYQHVNFMILSNVHIQHILEYVKFLLSSKVILCYHKLSLGYACIKNKLPCIAWNNIAKSLPFKHNICRNKINLVNIVC